MKEYISFRKTRKLTYLMTVRGLLSLMTALMIIRVTVKIYSYHNQAPSKLQATPRYTPVQIPDVNTSGRHWAYTVYPVGGTGIRVNISDSFDASIMNSICNTPAQLRAVLPIYSSVDRFELRHIVRNTLGRWAKKLNCKIVFISGVSLDRTINDQIQQEYYREKDIVMMDKVDAYRDLDDKAVLMVEWLSRYCAHVPYAIHLIDDAFVNLKLFLDRLDSIEDKNYILGGNLFIKHAPRDRHFKTFVTKEEYPYHEIPYYAIGFAYAFPTNISERLLSVVYTAKYCWIEDVWFTGLVRQAAGIRLENLKQNKQWVAEENKHRFFPKLFNGLPNYYFIHSMQPEHFYWLYSTVSD